MVHPFFLWKFVRLNVTCHMSGPKSLQLCHWMSLDSLALPFFQRPEPQQHSPQQFPIKSQRFPMWKSLHSSPPFPAIWEATLAGSGIFGIIDQATSPPWESRLWKKIHLPTPALKIVQGKLINIPFASIFPNLLLLVSGREVSFEMIYGRFWTFVGP